MGAVRFLPDNEWIEAVLTASSEADGLPAGASTNPDRSYVWRSKTQTADQTLQGTLSAAVACTMVAVANIKAMNAGTVKLQQAGSGVTPGAWVDVVELPAAHETAKVAVAFFATTARHWRLYFTNGAPANADYAEVGYVGLGAYFEPSRVMPVGYEMPIHDPTVITRSLDGQETSAARSVYMACELGFYALNQADLDSLDAMRRAVAVRTPMFMTLDLEKNWKWYLGRLRSPLAIEPMKGNQFEVTVGFEEAR